MQTATLLVFIIYVFFTIVQSNPVNDTISENNTAPALNDTMSGNSTRAPPLYNNLTKKNEQFTQAAILMPFLILCTIWAVSRPIKGREVGWSLR